MSGEILQGDLRPEIVSGDVSANGMVAPEVEEVARLGNCLPAKLCVKTGMDFVDQWNGQHIFHAFPFSLPLSVSGADWPRQERTRRTEEYPLLSPMGFCKMLAGRVEGCIRNSWDLVPSLRRITSKWHCVTQIQGYFPRQTPGQDNTAVAALKAAKSLYGRLEKGFWEQGGKRRKINMDTTKLPQAENLSPMEKELLKVVRGKQRFMPGSPEIRRTMGHALFGLRVEHGEPLFVTISPNMRHSGLVLNMSRYRRGDPATRDNPENSFAANVPCMWQNMDTVTIDLPRHEFRKQLVARDPWAVCLAFQQAVRLILGQLFGLRWCGRCPECSCQDMCGSSGHIVGGVLGYVSAAGGAVEYQRCGAPHWHGNVHLRNVFQMSLSKLAERIEAGLVEPKRIFEFHAWMHRESHPLEDVHRSREGTLEAEWMQNWASKDHDRLCLLPSFVYRDQNPSAWQAQCDPFSPENVTEGQEYIQRYKEEAQYVMSHVQHHVHKTDGVTGAKIPLRACQDRRNRAKCKHGFPMDLRVSEQARVVCPGNCKRMGLRCRGRRNALGLVAGVRNDAWVSGTCTALTVMLRSNTHTHPNYRIPLVSATHDPTCSRRQCLGGQEVKRMEQAMSRAGHRATGYFCGYIQKAQPVGRAEVVRAGGQLDYLQHSMGNLSDKQAFVRVANRMLGDLEYRSCIRPLTEEFMLSGYSDKDVLGGEFLRTFSTAPFLGMELLRIEEQRASAPIIKLKRSASQSLRITNQYSLLQLYGYRGPDPRVFWLNAWEFVKWWELVDVVSGQDAGKPLGLHAKCEISLVDFEKAQKGITSDVVVFPTTPETLSFSSVCALRRRRTPVVPRPTFCKLPRADTGVEERGRLFNVYLRPWVLVREWATSHVPHISDLSLLVSDVVSAAEQRQRRVRGKTTPSVVEHTRSHEKAWLDYRSAHVVSQHARDVIRGFEAATQAKMFEEEDDMEQAQNSKAAAGPADTSWVDGVHMEAILAWQEGNQKDMGWGKRAGAAAVASSKFWEQGQMKWKARGERDGEVESDVSVTEVVQGEKQAKAAGNCKKTNLLYEGLSEAKAKEWLKKLEREPEKPTAEQLSFLSVVVERCLVEQREELGNEDKQSEPVRMLLHGVPGAGKSRCIHWLRRFFEDICKFTHGVEFAFACPFNTQAALIGGLTLHTFGHVKIKQRKLGAMDALKDMEHNVNKHFVEFGRLRWLLIDECSGAGLEVLAAINRQLLTAIRVRDSWKQRSKGEMRPFAGVNVVLAGDLWQFGPVKATSITQNPRARKAGPSVQQMQAIFWSCTADALTHLRELTQEQRCTDAWLSFVLKCARHGNMPEEIWAFLHGYPTQHVGSWNPWSSQAMCKNAACLALQKTWGKQALAGKLPSWSARVQEECGCCAAERKRRCVVAGSCAWSPDARAEKFLVAPFIHGLNAAKYAATHRRARCYAAAKGLQLLWVLAADTCVNETNAAETVPESTKMAWLKYHDQQTAGVSGVLGLVVGMPIRVTQARPEWKKWNVRKNTRGALVGWKLEPTDVERARNMQSGELILQKLPVYVVVKIQAATWIKYKRWGPGCLKISPVRVVWSPTNSAMSVVRYGLPLASDFCGTAHSFQGSTLAACTVHLGSLEDIPSQADQLAGYMTISRVRDINDITVVEPFSPRLFCQEELIGPQCVLQIHRGEISAAEALTRYETWEKVSKKRIGLQDLLLNCWTCALVRGLDSGQTLRPLKEFVGQDASKATETITMGADRECLRCRKVREGEGVDDRPDVSARPCEWCKTRLGEPLVCKTCAELKFPCRGCAQQKKGKHLPLLAFVLEQVRMAKMNRCLGRLRCKKCAARVARPQCFTYTCQGPCAKVRAEKFFLAGDVRKKDASKVLICKDCKRIGEQLQCSVCNQRKPTLVLQKIGKRHVCVECRSPRCVQCKKVLPFCKAGKTFYCSHCAYPPCQCGRARPKKMSYHITRKVTWKCLTCERSSKEGAKESKDGGMPETAAKPE